MIENNIDIDFGGDDFANDKEVLRLRTEKLAYDKLGNDVMDIIRNRFRMEDSTEQDLEDYLSYRNLEAAQLKTLTTDLKGYELNVLLIEYYSSYPAGKYRNSGYDRYIIGHFTTQTKYPRTYIHKETVGEKISEIFLRREVDFKDSKKFSRKFQVLTENRKRLTDLLQLKDLDNLAKFPDMELELSAKGCFFRQSRNSISLMEAERFSDLTTLLIKLFV